MLEIRELPLASIEVGADRARDLDPAWVEGLAGSIREQGLMQPIVVRRVGDNWRLVAGHHRLEAVRLLGRDTIAALEAAADSDDAAKLAEVMENLARNELIALDRCRHLYELKVVWERLHPDFANGGGQTLPTGDEQGEIFGFASTVADKIGLAKRTINHCVKIWKGLAPQTRQRLRGTDLARKQTELKALSEIVTPRKQAAVLDAIFDEGLPDVGNVAQALAHLGGTLACDPIERRFEKVSQTLSSLDDDLFDDLILAHESRVISTLRRRGRI